MTQASAIVFTPGQILPCPKEAVAEPFIKIPAIGSPVHSYQVLEVSCS